jgi:hypothetical protein
VSRGNRGFLADCCTADQSYGCEDNGCKPLEAHGGSPARCASNAEGVGRPTARGEATRSRPHVLPESRSSCREAAPDHLGALSPFTALAAAATLSERLRLRTYVLNVGFWNPALLAARSPRWTCSPGAGPS